MLSFKKKIFLSYIALFLFFLALIFSSTPQIVRQIIFKLMQDRATEITERIRFAPNNEILVRRLRDQKHLLFFRVSVITDKRKTLYDSHIKRILGPKFSQEEIVDHPEVLEAFKTGEGYHEAYSELLGQTFAYMAKTFDFHGKTYVMRTAYPYKYISELTHYFEIGFLLLLTVVLLLFSSLNWFIINHLLNPVQQIIKAVSSYQESGNHPLPEIILRDRGTTMEIRKLADTLNSLSRKVQKQINTLTDERNEKSAILESLAEGVIAIDGSMRIAYANQIALHFLSATSDQLIGNDCSEINEEHCLTLLNQSQESGQTIQNNLTLKHENGKLFLDLIASPIEGGSKGAVLVMQDKSSHYKILEMRKDFIANASHELKTPVTIIKGFAETLHENPDLPKETCVEITEKIVKNCNRMTKLIKDLLTLADIEHIPESRLTECDLHDLTRYCCEVLEDAYPDASITLTPEESEAFCITGDVYLMEMALMNLIENAAKYSEGPAQISITFEAKENFIEMKISDRGIGIPAKDLEHIFERFYTVNKRQSVKKGGAGLGLSLVETIVEKHFGKIKVNSEVGVGTTFTLLFPKQRLRAQQE